MWTENFQTYKLDLEKAEEPDQIANIHRIIEKAKEFQKNIHFCFTDYTKTFDCMETLSCVQLFAIPWTVAYQAPPSMEFPRQ